MVVPLSFLVVFQLLYLVSLYIYLVLFTLPPFSFLLNSFFQFVSFQRGLFEGKERVSASCWYCFNET